MNRWKEAFDKHPIHETITWLDNAASSNVENLSEGEVEEQRRLKKIVDRYRSALESVDPEIVPVNQLDSLNAQLRHQNVANQVNAYIQNKKTPHLVAINDHVSKQLTQLSLIQSLSDSSESKEKTSYIDSVVDSTINGLAAKKEALEAQLKDVLLATDEQAKKLVALSEEINQKQAELTQLSSDWQKQFSTAQDYRAQEFSKWRDAFSSEKNKEVKEVIDSYRDFLKDSSEQLNSKLNAIIEDSSSKHKSILDLYELTAGDSVGAAYIQSADNEKKQANQWRRISIGFIVTTVLWLTFSFFYNSVEGNKFSSTPDTVVSQDVKPAQESNNKDLNYSHTEINTYDINAFPWRTMLVAFSISGVLLWGSAYSAQQSTKHRNNEKRARWFALEVKAFDPFISSLETQQQQELKRQLAERIFGQNSTSEEDPKVIDEHALRTVTDAFEKVLSKFSK
ncbi:hypothetical protein [Oceanimonas smirnovii]|uniref:hypothetical protein n=1 Tax=Oceanimonas smirnovii TaxID=264574 RepID=UPI003FD43CBF